MHKKIMIQGTGSSVGKSIIVTGLCRIFSQDGFRVSPFKSQNMALNSFVDIEGLEMGRAQVVQAEAAKEVPRSFMNPILLKPNSDNNSQVIIEGKPFKNMDAKSYFANSKSLKEIAKKNYNYISKNYDIAVIEGGGSPAEINLRENDCVNMGLAEIIDAPVILVGNIEIGGVFASLYGTVALLDKKDRKRIKGYIINKFRGDIELLKPGIDMLNKKFQESGWNIKFLGVLPYENIDIEEEDSITKTYIEDFKEKVGIKISIIKIDKMSNFTDFNVLRKYKDVELRYISKANELGEEDVIILPGSKNTISDLIKLKNNGIYNKIKELYKKGVIIVGICGGFQMLGKEISDPYGIESDISFTKGFSFLDTKTVLEKIKCTKQSIIKLENNYKGTIIEGCECLELKGYEIHQGVTTLLDKKINFIVKDNLIGTYVHGVFDNSKFTEIFLNNIRKRKNLDLVREEFSYVEYKEKQYDRLADLIRKNIDLSSIYDIME